MDEHFWKIIFSPSSGALVAVCLQAGEPHSFEIAVDKTFTSENEAEFAVLALNSFVEPMDLLRAVRLLEGD